MGRNLLIIAHDDVDTLDRRIVNEARIFIEHGWNAQVLCLTQRSESDVAVLEPNLFVRTIPVSQIVPPYDPLFEHWQQLDPSAQPKRTVWQKIRRRIAYHLSYYQRVFRLLVGIRQLPTRLKRLIKGQIRHHLAPYPRLRKMARRVSSSLINVKNRFLRRNGQPTAGASPGIPQDWYPLPFTDVFLKYAATMQSDAIMACDLPALPAGHELAQRWNVPLIYDSHEFYVEQSAFGPRQKYVMEHHEARCLPRTDLFMTVSDLFAEQLQAKYQLPEIPRVLYNAPAFQKSTSGNETDVRYLLGIPDTSTMLLHHGGLVATRNLERLISGFAAVAPEDAYLVLIGYGDHKNALTELADRVGNGRIIIRDAVPQDDLPAWIGAADAVVIPYPATEKNNEFCMPNKLSDCIELTCPVIGNSGLVCVSRILDRYHLGVAGPMDTDADMESTIGRGLKWLQDNGPQQADFESARRIYGWDTQREKLIAWLDELGLAGFEPAENHVRETVHAA